jgi:DNA-binding MarR family transcriptional regulator
VEQTVIALEMREMMIAMKRHLANQHKSVLMDIHGMQVWTIIFLNDQSDKEIFQKDLEKQFSIRRPTATTLLKRLEELGYITRVPVDYDARLKKIVLTQKAKDATEQMQIANQELQKLMEESITPEEKEQFISTLRKIKENLLR